MTRTKLPPKLITSAWPVSYNDDFSAARFPHFPSDFPRKSKFLDLTYSILTIHASLCMLQLSHSYNKTTMPTPHDWCPTLNRNRPILLFSHAATPTILLGWSARAGSRPISSTRTVPLVVGKRLTRAMQKEPCWTRPANGKDIKTNMDVESCLKSCLIKIDVLDEHLVYNNIPLVSYCICKHL